ncbi:TylF/MycF/NovP-related O-methyltransferase [Methylomonas fluvii]|uniref:Methyltransferase n=1 Tax=Methylomonas fluvii TaxID=1854564 RepID=A0ABR9DKM6_9GAMM|nr:TylF/MycF/NovP-related O-methyltransferase [Methylomonas fluvii]MBD9362437.1 methyltransferase [Methylomonas fluvii]CAD6875537.1 hypothetical protein [Methylomonas fluvii]
MTISLLDTLNVRYRRLRVASNLHRMDTLRAMHRAWAYVHATVLPGDYYEFAVYKDNSLINSWLSQQHFRRRLEHSDKLPFARTGTVANFLARKPTFYGFDTFEGMPDNSEGEDALASGSFQCAIADVTHRCAVAGLVSPTVRLIPWLFAETKSQIGPAQAAIVHIDCDLYQSTVDALDSIAPLTQGTVLLFDDYNLFRADKRRGERRALTEFTLKTGLTLDPWFSYGPAAQAFLCHE